MSYIPPIFTALSGTVWTGWNYKTLSGNIVLTTATRKTGYLHLTNPASHTVTVNGASIPINNSGVNGGITLLEYYTVGTDVWVRDKDGNPILASADVTAPTVVSREATAAHTIEVVYSEVVNAASSTGNSFNNGGALTISGMTGTGTNTLTFTITETMTDADTITHTYTGTVIEDAAGNDLAAFTSQAVTNSIPASGGLVDLTFLAHQILGPHVNTAQRFTSTGSGYTVTGWGHRAVDALMLGAGDDGYLQSRFFISNEDVNNIYGWHTADPITSGASTLDPKYCYYCDGGTNELTALDNGSNTATGFTPSTGDYLRVVVTGRASTPVFKLQSSPDGVTWTDRHTYAGTDTAALYVLYDIQVGVADFATGHLNQPKGFGLS